jgi:hypothetical protein
MDNEFITYQRFDDIILAEELTDLLQASSIPYRFEEQSFLFDPSLVMSKAKKEYAIKIKSDDFEKADRLLEANEAKNVEAIDKDYYLFSFSDDELQEVLIKSDEWSAFDVVLARKIFGDRGKAISDVEIEKIRNDRIQALKQPDSPQSFWIVVGYAAALLGGVLGIFIGWHLFTYKKTIPNGERIYGYSEKDRKQGTIIFYLSIIICIIGVILKIRDSYNEGF